MSPKTVQRIASETDKRIVGRKTIKTASSGQVSYSKKDFIIINRDGSLARKNVKS